MKDIKVPTAADVKKARQHAGLSQKKAAEVIGYTGRSWQLWEAGKHAMHPALFLYFKQKVVAKS
jgi:DNA-binding transcriptional regulator YiaG